jgi:predicted Ser/Thr protein kinase
MTPPSRTIPPHADGTSRAGPGSSRPAVGLPREEIAAGTRLAGLPAPWNGLAWRPLAPIRNRTKPAVYIAEHGNGQVVCKDASGVRSGPWRLYRRMTLRFEGRAMERLAGIRGVPRLLDRWRTGLVMEAVPGRMLTTWRRGAAPPGGAFDDLDRIIAEAHARGVVLGDVHRRNILVDTDGRVHLVDFEVALDVSRVPGRLLRRTGMTVDRIGAARQRERFGVPLSAEQAFLLAHLPWRYRIVKDLKRRMRMLVRKQDRTP